ncbi:hypothetical protein PVAP13_3NG258166, partial [Panicum virgatum]
RKQPGLVWEPEFPPGFRPFPSGGLPRGIVARAKFPAHLEAHAAGQALPGRRSTPWGPGAAPSCGLRAPPPSHRVPESKTPSSLRPAASRPSCSAAPPSPSRSRRPSCRHVVCLPQLPVLHLPVHDLAPRCRPPSPPPPVRDLQHPRSFFFAAAKKGSRPSFGHGGGNAFGAGASSME